MVATNSRSADELAAPLDLLLTSSAVGMADRMLPNVAWSRFALSLAKQPRTVASRAAALGWELVSIAEGRSDVAPAKGDKRFADPAWRGNPLLHRTMQAYLAANNTVEQLFSDVNLDWRDAERIRFALAEREILSVDGMPLHVTASFGVATSNATTTVQQLVEAADEALYRAKRAGKDRVYAGTDPVTRL